jgi:hypothetical protein
LSQQYAARLAERDLWIVPFLCAPFERSESQFVWRSGIFDFCFCSLISICRKLLLGLAFEFDRFRETRFEATIIRNYVTSSRGEVLELPSGMSLPRIIIGSS